MRMVVPMSQVIKNKKKIGEENVRKAVETVTKAAEVALSEGKAFCISHVCVGSDTAAIREAVVKTMEQKGMAVMVFSTDEQSKKTLVCAGVPINSNKSEQLKVKEWLDAALKPIYFVFMADFEAPSFSLGLDCDSDPEPEPEPQISFVSEEDDYGSLIVDDSEPAFYSDPHPKLKRLRRLLTTDVTTTTTSSSTISEKSKAELNTSPVIGDEDDDVFCLQEDGLTDEHLHTQNCALTNQSGKKSQTIGQRRRFLLTLSDSDSDVPSVSNTTNNPKSNVLNSFDSVDLSTTDMNHRKQFRSEKSLLNLDDESLPPSLYYFFHNDKRIQELVQTRLPNFSPLWKMSNRDLEQLSTSEIDYMGQFISKEVGRNIKDNKTSSKRKFSRKEKIEEISQGWVNPKVCVDNGIRKGDSKRKVHGVPKSAGYWLTGTDGKRVSLFIPNYATKLYFLLIYVTMFYFFTIWY
ncbi:hypothetical protein LXL04_037428 [Taraxacum kok-saghyz]